MATNIIPFDSATQLPARRTKMAVSTDIAVGSDYPSISIRGRVFSIVQDGTRTPITRQDSDEPRSVVDMVILRANSNVRQYYAGTFDESSEGTQPDCFSMDGLKPDAQAQQPQCATCAQCHHATFGTSQTGKGQACKPATRIAVATPNHLDKPYLMRVPITSVQRDKSFHTGLRDMVAACKTRGLEYNEVLTQIGFDYHATGVKLTFKPIGILPDDVYEKACAMYDDPMVLSIVGKPSMGVAAAPAAPPAGNALARAASMLDDEQLSPEEAAKRANLREAARASSAGEPGAHVLMSEAYVEKQAKAAKKVVKAAKKPADDGDVVTEAAPQPGKVLDNLDSLLGDFDA